MESSAEGLQKMKNRGTTAFSNSNSEYRSKRVENRIWKIFTHFYDDALSPTIAKR